MSVLCVCQLAKRGFSPTMWVCGLNSGRQAFFSAYWLQPALALRFWIWESSVGATQPWVQIPVLPLAD